MLMNSDFVSTRRGCSPERRRRGAGRFRPRADAPRHASACARTRRLEVRPRRFDEGGQGGRFTPLPHLTGSQPGRAGRALPDPATGWAILHGRRRPHRRRRRATPIRRWTPPADGTLSIAGQAQALGTVATASAGGSSLACWRLVGQWSVVHGEAATTGIATSRSSRATRSTSSTDCVGDVNRDSFDWTVKLKLAAGSGKPAGGGTPAADFRGPSGAASAAAAVAYAWPLVYQRPITADELDWACAFLRPGVVAARAPGAGVDGNRPC